MLLLFLGIWSIFTFQMKKAFKLLFIIGLISYISTDVWIYFAYRKIDKQEREFIMRILAWHKALDQAVPPNILKAYETVNPGSITSTIRPDIVWIFLEISGHNHNIYREVAQNFHLTQFTCFSMANQIEDKFTPQECITFKLRNCVFNRQAASIDQIAWEYYSKSLANLNPKESLELIIMSNNPSLYDKHRHPEILAEKLKEFVIDAQTADVTSVNKIYPDTIVLDKYGKDWRSGYSTFVVHHNDSESIEYKFNEGKMISEAPFKRGLHHGVFKQYFPNGQLFWEIHYSNDKRIGSDIMYYESGQKWIEYDYNEQGNRDGTAFTWHENGKQRSVAYYNNGIQDSCYFYNSSGGLESIYYYKNNQTSKEVRVLYN